MAQLATHAEDADCAHGPGVGTYQSDSARGLGDRPLHAIGNNVPEDDTNGRAITRISDATDNVSGDGAPDHQ